MDGTLRHLSSYRFDQVKVRSETDENVFPPALAMVQ